MVADERLPVLWLCGAPATGESTVGWQVSEDLADQGLCVGYLDIDQIGMLHPRRMQTRTVTGPVDAHITFCHLTVRARSACCGNKLPNKTHNLHRMIIE